jgi:hypothetical protein
VEILVALLKAEPPERQALLQPELTRSLIRSAAQTARISFPVWLAHVGPTRMTGATEPGSADEG